MARTNKVGMDYFSFDVDFFNDDKIQLIEAEFGTKGSIVAIRLLCKIYNEGYYYGWGGDQCLLFAKNAGSEFTPQSVQDIVNGLIRRMFFDANCYEKYQILTSIGIQRRYLAATDRYKEVKMIKEYLLIEVPDRDNIIINSINVCINSINVDINPQKKRNRKGNINKKETELKNDIYPFDDFWNDYDKKVGSKDKINNKWIKISDKNKLLIKEHIPLYKDAQPDKAFRKDPATYLNNESWNDEIIKSKSNYNGHKHEETKSNIVDI